MFKKNIINLLFLSLSFFLVSAQEDYYKIGAELGKAGIKHLKGQLDKKSEKKAFELGKKLNKCIENQNSKGGLEIIRGLIDQIKNELPNKKNKYLGLKFNQDGFCVNEIIKISVDYLGKIFNIKNFDKTIDLKAKNQKAFEGIDHQLNSKLFNLINNMNLSELKNLILGNELTDFKLLVKNIKDLTKELKKSNYLDFVKNELKNAKFSKEETDIYLEATSLLIEFMTEIVNVKNIEKLDYTKLKNFDFFIKK